LFVRVAFIGGTLAGQDSGTLQEQTNPLTKAEHEEKRPADQANKQNGDGAKAEILDNFEIQRRIFLGK